MSQPPSNLRLRNTVFTQLSALLAAPLKAGGPLAATPSEVDAFLTDRRLVDVAAQYRAMSPSAPNDGHAAIVTAGPPGAGKTTVTAGLAADYRRIDPDEIKNVLLTELARAGFLDVRFDHLVADGRPVMPGELASWVHPASTHVADLVRAQSLADGENFVMHGTLAWQPIVGVYRAELAAHGYVGLTIIDIETPRGIAAEQARTRWWAGRNGGTPLGGRFIPDNVIDGFYQAATDQVSMCAENAHQLYDAGIDLAMTTELRILHHDRRIARSAVITPTGVRPWGIPNQATASTASSVCHRCGRTLSSLASIAAGYGPECRQHDANDVAQP